MGRFVALVHHLDEEAVVADPDLVTGLLGDFGEQAIDEPKNVGSSTT